MARVADAKNVRDNIWLLTYEDGTSKLVKVNTERLKEIVAEKNNAVVAKR